MSDRILILTHKEKEVLLLDYSNLRNNDEIILCTQQCTEFIRTLNRNDLLLLLDVANTFFYGAGYIALKEFSLNTKSLIKREAVIGVHGIAHRILFDSINLSKGINTMAFDSLNSALDYLTDA